MEPEPTVFLCPSCKCKFTAGKTSSGLNCPNLSSLVLTCPWLYLTLSVLVLTCLNRRKNNKCLDLSPLWERGWCGGDQKLCGRNMESSWTIGRAASGTTFWEKNKTTSTSKWAGFTFCHLHCLWDPNTELAVSEGPGRAICLLHRSIRQVAGPCKPSL